MGQAKQRGTFEQRKAESVQREEERQRQYEAEYRAKQEQQRQYDLAHPRQAAQRRASSLSAQLVMATAVGISLGATTTKPNGEGG